MSLLQSFLFGLVLSFLIGWTAYRRGSLTRSGMAGAILTGTAIFSFGGFIPGILLIAFFVSSTILSRYRAQAKDKVTQQFQKGSQRDLGQALANGGWAALIACGLGFAEYNHLDPRLTLILTAAFVGAIATVTADTWATEIGVLSQSQPRLITTWRAVPVGTSGGVTLLGTLTALAGAVFIGLVLFLVVMLASLSGPLTAAGTPILPSWSPDAWKILLIAVASGLLGSLFDSLLGATVQGIYFAEYDERQTEKRTDSVGNPTRLVRGIPWIDNDVVNFLASVFGSAVAGGLAYWFL